MNDIPDLKTVFPCPGLRSLGTERYLVSREARWFLEKAAPTLHMGAMEVLNILAFALQEMEEESDGTRVGLAMEDLGDLIQQAMFLQLDTIQLIASMQIHRASLATQRAPPISDEVKEQAILSDRAKEEAKKLQTLSRYGQRRGNGRWGRRPRFAPESIQADKSRLSMISEVIF